MEIKSESGRHHEPLDWQSTASAVAAEQSKSKRSTLSTVPCHRMKGEVQSREWPHHDVSPPQKCARLSLYTTKETIVTS